MEGRVDDKRESMWLRTREKKAKTTQKQEEKGKGSVEQCWDIYIQIGWSKWGGKVKWN